MGGSKQTTTQKLPSWAEDAFKTQMERANLIAQQGYVPYQGADIAGFTPQQTNAMQSAANWDAAFAGPGAKALDVASTIPQAQKFTDGTVGYSSYPGFIEQMAAFRHAYPGQAKFIESMAINPSTGAKNKPGDIKSANLPSNKGSSNTSSGSWWDQWHQTFGRSA